MTAMTLAQLLRSVGKTVGTSEWITIDQTRINEFAKCTGDHQWIHVDVDRARKETPYRVTIAHGLLSLALIVPLAMELGLAPTDASAVLNYGVDKLRFITPVRCGDSVRLQLSIESAESRECGRVLIRSKAILEIENIDTPALVAEMLTLVVPDTREEGASVHIRCE